MYTANTNRNSASRYWKSFDLKILFPPIMFSILDDHHLGEDDTAQFKHTSFQVPYQIPT